MNRIDDLRDHRAKTIAHWANWKYPRAELDVLRVQRFQLLDPETATNAQVSEAYGGHGWATIESCAECSGEPEERVVLAGVTLCLACLERAVALYKPASNGRGNGLFTRIFGG